MSPLLLAGLVGAYALAYRVEFEVGSGLAIATQLVFVPMLFLLPLPLVPFAVAAGAMLANLPSCRRTNSARSGSSPGSAKPLLARPRARARAPRASEPALANWPLYVFALGAQFASDFAAAAAHERIALGCPAAAAGKDLCDRRGRRRCARADRVPRRARGADQPQSFLLMLPLVALLRTFARERRTRIDHALELSHAYRGTALLLGDVVEADDSYTGSHSRDVVSLSVAVADELGLDARARRDTEFVALLHDVGKVQIPKEIINKPGPLTPEERALIETHTVIGEEMLDKVGGVLGKVGHLVRSCHERYDGGGYPDGLVGEEIPLVARIVCCCDAYNAITTDRPYRAGRSAEEALAELRRCSGTHFDPQVVEALARVV